MRKRIYYLLSLMAVVLLAACGKTAEPNKSQVTVVTSLRVYQEVAQAVLGTHGKATAIINNANTDPHDFEPTTATGKLVADANLVISNGLGYDDWLDKLQNAANPDVAHIQVAEDVLHRQDGDNEHVFYDPNVMPKLAAKLAAKFAKLDPQHAQAYKTNARKYVASLAPLQRLIKQLRNSGAKKYAASSEPVFDYGLQAAGYKLIDKNFAKSIEDGTDPTPQELTSLRKDLMSHKISVFVNNKQSDSAIVKQVVATAKKAGVKVVNVRETQPNHETYLKWMLSNYRQLQ